MTEFALIAPVLLLLLFGIIDFGRAIYTYITINQAVNEGVRVAIRDSATLPTNSDVETAVRVHAVDVVLSNPCPNGPITSTSLPDSTGWIFITEPQPNPPPTTPEGAWPYLNNAPGGQSVPSPNPPSGSCSATDPASGHKPLQVTIVYNFVPITPLIRQATGKILITASATYRTEY